MPVLQPRSDVSRASGLDEFLPTAEPLKKFDKNPLVRRLESEYADFSLVEVDQHKRSRIKAHLACTKAGHG